MSRRSTRHPPDNLSLRRHAGCSGPCFDRQDRRPRRCRRCDPAGRGHGRLQWRIGGADVPAWPAATRHRRDRARAAPFDARYVTARRQRPSRLRAVGGQRQSGDHPERSNNRPRRRRGRRLRRRFERRQQQQRRRLDHDHRVPRRSDRRQRPAPSRPGWRACTFSRGHCWAERTGDGGGRHTNRFSADDDPWRPDIGRRAASAST